MIVINNFSGKIHQTINIKETDYIYNDLIKYIQIPKYPLFDELNIKNKRFKFNVFMMNFRLKKFVN